MTPEEFEALRKAAAAGALTEAQRQALAAEIRRRLVEQFGEKSLEAMEKEVAMELAKKPVKTPGWWVRLFWLLRGWLTALAEFLGPLGAGALLIVALALLGYSIYNVATSKPATLVSGVPCGGNAATALGPVSDSGTFQTEVQLFNSAMAQAQQMCNGYASKCPVASAPPACLPLVSLQTFDISNYWVWRKVTLLNFNCTCEK